MNQLYNDAGSDMLTVALPCFQSKIRGL